MDRRAAGALLALAACFASSAAAPTVSNQTALDIYDAASEGCYYNFQHYGEGDRIMTNEPCLNCTCHNRMLMCYLRVCPFTKPIGQDCTVEKRADQCCPIVTCPDVPVDLLTSTSTSSPAEYGATGLGKLDKFGCSINGKYFPEGSKVPPTPNKPCEHCYCIRNMTTCVMQECTLHVDGCTPIYHKDVCCPVRYSCDHPEDELPLLDDMSTTVRPTPGFLLTTTTLAPVTQMTQDCVHNDQIFPDGTSIKTEKACEHCYCMKGDIVCVVQECGTPMENEGKNCTSQPPREGQCCPDTYICEGDEVTTELLLDYTTEPSLDRLTTLVPPRRVIDEGSGYRKEEEEPIATVLPSIEPEIEGSGEDFATLEPSAETEKETPGLFDDRIASTEDLIGVETTPETIGETEESTERIDETEKSTETIGETEKSTERIGETEKSTETIGETEKSTERMSETEKSTETIGETEKSTETIIETEKSTETIIETEKSTVEPDTALNTVPSDVTEPANISEPKLTTKSEDAEKSQETKQTHADADYSTASPTEKEQEVYVQTTESAFRKEDATPHIPLDITTEKSLEEYTTVAFEPTKISEEERESSISIIETKATTTSEIATEIPTTTTSHRFAEESSTSLDHTFKEETFTTVAQYQTETTTLNAQENEIEDITTTQGPGRIPGEGDCLQNGVTYRNESTIPSSNNCLTDCKCISSIIKCDPIICSPPPEYMDNCVPIYDSSEACCPTYVCDGSKETLPPQPHSQMSETKSSTPTPAVDCQDDQCGEQKVDTLGDKNPSEIPKPTECGTEGCSDGVQKIDQVPAPVPSYDCGSGSCEKPSNIPVSTDCGTEGCGDVVQTPVQTEIQPECSSENCGPGIQTEPQEVSPIPSDTCSGSECQQHPIIEKEKDDSIPCDGDNCKVSPVCQNEEECKAIKTPEVESCNGQNCDRLPERVLPTCEGENCGSNVQQPECLDEECKNTDMTGKSPVECSGDDCISQPDKTEISTERSITTQEKITQLPVTESLPMESTVMPVHDDLQTSSVIEQVTTEKGVEMTEPEVELQSSSQSTSEKPLSDSEESLKTSTAQPVMETTVFEKSKETTSVSDLDLQTDSKQGEIITTSAISQETEEPPTTTKLTDIVTKQPEIAAATEISVLTEALTEESLSSDKQSTPEETSIPEKSTEVSHNEDVSASPTESPDTKPESETPGSVEFDSSAQPSTEISKPIFDITSQDQLYTKEPESGSGEETTDFLNIPTESIIPDDKYAETEKPAQDIGESSQPPVTSSEFEKDITTSLPEIIEKKTEQTPFVTSAIPELNTTPSNDIEVSTESHNKKPEIHDLEPTMQTTSVSDSYDDREQPNRQDSETTVKPGEEFATTQSPISLTTDENKPPIDKESVPELPIEETFTEQTEIETEEPSLINKQDEVTPQEPFEPESPAYIPVHPTVGDKLEDDLIDKTTTPDSGSNVMLSTEQEHHSETPETQTEQSLPETEKDEKSTEAPVETSPTDNRKYDVDTENPTEASVETSPTDNRKYNQDSTEVFELDELTTASPKIDKITPETSTSDEELFATKPSESFSDEKLEISPTEAPESHVKETESEVKLTTVPEIATEKLESIQTEQPETSSPPLAEPKPTEFQPPTLFVEMEKETTAYDSESSTNLATESTPVPVVEYSETTPDMIELVEHNEMMDISTQAPSISDRDTTTGVDTEKIDDTYTTEKLVTPPSELEPDTTIKINVPPEKPEASTERDTTDQNQMEPEEMPKTESSTEIGEADKESFTRQPEKPDFENQTSPSEDAQTVEPEISTDVDQRTTEHLREYTTETVDLDVGSETEEPDKQYSTKKPEVESNELESTTLISEMPSVDEYKEPTIELSTTRKPEIEQEPVEPESTTVLSLAPNLDETINTEEPTIENEVIPDEENVKTTVIPEVQEEITPERETTEKPELITKEEGIKPDQELITENPMVSETVKESEVESSTEQKLLPESDHVTDVPQFSVTEKEPSLVPEIVTKEPALEITESSTEISAISVPEDKFESQPSTQQPETMESERNVVDDKSSTEDTTASEVEKETDFTEITDEVKPDEEIHTPPPLATTQADIDTNVDKESKVKVPERSDIDNEISPETTATSPEKENVSSTEAAIAEQPTPNIDDEIEKKPSTESVLSEFDNLPVAVTEQPNQQTEDSDKYITNVPYTSEIDRESEKESSTAKSEESTTILSVIDSKTTKHDIPDDQTVPEIVTKEPEISVDSVTKHETQPPKLYTTDLPEISSVKNEASTEEPVIGEKEVTKPSISEILEEGVEDKISSSTSEPAVLESESTEKATTTPAFEEYTKSDEREKETITESEIEKLTTISDLSSTPLLTETEKLPDVFSESTPTIPDASKQEEDITKYTTPAYSPKEKDETTVSITKTEKPYTPEEEITVQSKPETEKPIDLAKDTTAPEEEFLTVTSKATTPKVDIETSTHSEEIPKPHEVPEETSSVAPDIPKPGFNEVPSTDDTAVPDEESHFAPSATGGYGQEPDYEDESQPFGPGTCRYGGKVYVSAQQIPRDDPCDFCFCFRSDIICLQQSCPPPIHGCHEEPIQGFCCPRYECPVSMANTLNVTTTTTTTTTTLPPHFLPHAYQGAMQRRGCQIKGHTYKVGEVVRASSGPCLHCTCGGDGQMKCDPKACTPEPMLRQMIAAAVSAKRRR